MTDSDEYSSGFSKGSDDEAVQLSPKASPCLLPYIAVTTEDSDEYSNQSDTENSDDDVIQFAPTASPHVIPSPTVTTEGVTNMIHPSLSKCENCNKSYKKSDTMVNNIYDMWICWHCFFWPYYDPALRQEVDGVYGKTIAEYILDCRDSHDKDACTRKDSCFLCDNLNGKIITNIICGEMIQLQDDTKDSTPIPVEDDDDITVEI
jgi:hypothetical protein